MTLSKLQACALVLIFLNTISFAQTREHKWSVSVGGGPQDYKSNLGNGFSISKKRSWHGAGTAYVGTFMNPSLDLDFFGSIGDLSATRLKSVGLVFKYKFANGYLLNEENALKPYFYLGGAFNNLSDKLQVKTSNTNNFLSVNAGLGVRLNVWKRFYMGYNVAMGYFATAHDDLLLDGGVAELYFLNALLAGIDL